MRFHPFSLFVLCVFALLLSSPLSFVNSKENHHHDNHNVEVSVNVHVEVPSNEGRHSASHQISPSPSPSPSASSLSSLSSSVSDSPPKSSFVDNVKSIFSKIGHFFLTIQKDLITVVKDGKTFLFNLVGNYHFFSPSPEALTNFDIFKDLYAHVWNRKYSPQERVTRDGILHDNLLTLRSYQSQNPNAKYLLGLGSFGDVTVQEFTQKYLNGGKAVDTVNVKAFAKNQNKYKITTGEYALSAATHSAAASSAIKAKHHAAASHGASASSSLESASDDSTLGRFPPTLDWRVHPFQVISTIHSNGECGASYAAVSIATVESHWAIYKKQFVKLSEQQILECAKGYTCTSIPGCSLNGCQSGCVGGALEWLKTHGDSMSMAAENDYPFIASTSVPPTVNECRVVNSGGDAAAVKVLQVVGVQPNVNNIMAALQYGPLSAVLYGSSITYTSYTGGILHNTPSSPQTDCYPFKTPDDQKIHPPSHEVQIVGYGRDATLGLYWIVKDFLETDPKWGEKGYLRIAAGTNVCGIEMKLLFRPVVDPALVHPM